MKHPEIVSKMTLEQKAAFVTGADYWNLKGAPELGLPKINITDGSHGLRKQQKNRKASGGIGLNKSIPATCFPPAATSSCSWNMELLRQIGAAIGEECAAEGTSVLLGPGVNIKRSPVCGRNFEYYSEDPYLAGKCAAAFVQGVQSKGIGTSLKHFACNSQEAYRMVVNEVVDERAMRELYLTAFEICVKEAQPWTVMNAYNQVNGIYASQNGYLQNTILRKEWGFDGVVVTDWGSSVNRVPGLKCGTDLEMPSSGAINTNKIIRAVQRGELDEAILDTRVDNIVDLILKAKPVQEESHTYDADAHHDIARKVAEESMVLLKNEDGILPLKAGQKIALIGELAVSPRYQGAGTSIVNPTRIDNAHDALQEQGVSFMFAKGYEKHSDQVDPVLIQEAVTAAKEADTAVIFAGLTEEYEAEGYDRENMNLPENHNYLIEAVAQVNRNVVVVLVGGSVVEMRWLNKVKAVLNSGLGGQASGSAAANLLTGNVNPSGKTSETYPLSFKDNPTYGNYPGNSVSSEHRESVYIGYRYYDTANKEVLFPFGHGLSYTTFAYSDLHLSKKCMMDTDTVTVTFKVKNIGTVDGAEVAQLYVKDCDSTIFRPEKELRAFTKVFLKAGEEKTVSMELSKRAFAFYNTAAKDWTVEGGTFEILVGASSRDIRLKKELTVLASQAVEIPDYSMTAPSYYKADRNGMKGAEFAAVYGKALPPSQLDKTKKITIYNCLNDAKHTKWGKTVTDIIQFIMPKLGADGSGESAMLYAMATQIPIRNFVSMSMGVFTPKMAEALLMILNDDDSTAKGLGKLAFHLCMTLRNVPDLFRSI